MDRLREVIDGAYADGTWDGAEARAAVDATLDLLDRGEVRVAEKIDGGRGALASDWQVNEWPKLAILLSFRQRRMTTTEVGPFEYHDKIPLKRGYAEAGVRVVPPAVVRHGAFVERGAVLMPCYVNVGAWVGSGTMVDTWATVGSCAQIGRNVHLAGGVGIGGVLEPPGARPVIVEDDAFIGSRCIVTEGVIVERGAVLGAGVRLTGSIPIIDVTGSQPVTYKGRVPSRAIVVQGTRSKQFPAGTYQVSCALIIGYRSQATDVKVSLNDALREHDVAV
ncbi:MAG: 2,3,4,5-tetrahydropyridine-2,6-dicarboxylate N-succinyltransferase [Euzebyales bacterium]|nr:2,3,4,5-tetrahydropyridine-2,6-dicarboxylate N-succinyltransferase [Euzebyales bacterium]